MLNLKIIGAGAAGNKATIALVEHGFDPKDIVLINSTAKDIPEKYKDNAIIFGSNAATLGGCGKERDVGKKLILQDMKTGSISLDDIADPDTNAVVIVSSTEGGSGSAITPILAKYIKEVLGIPVIICLFFGFNTDVRGMQNSIEICQELSDDCGVIGISNYKFLEPANNNTIKAELLANDQFVKLIDIICGRSIIPGKQNIDDTDLFKLVITPGYMCIETANVSKIKNIDQFNKAIDSTIDDSVLVDCSEKGAKRIGIIYDISEDLSDYVDFTASALQNRYGTPYEMFTHIQNTGNNPSVTWISAGLPLPIKEVKDIYDNYLKMSAVVSKKKDSFFDSVMGMKGNQEDGMFNMLSINKNNNTRAKSSFFADFGIGGSDKPVQKQSKDKKSSSDNTEEY